MARRYHSEGNRPALQLSLLGGFAVRSGDEVVELPPEAQHLLAFLALRGRLVSREAIVGALWPEASMSHAYASLRSVLFRLEAVARAAIVVSNADLGLAPDVAVDLHDARTLAHRLLDTDVAPAPTDLPDDAIETLSADLLPYWHHEWAVIESEEWRQIRLHALDALALHLVSARRFEEAIVAAHSAVQAEPLRESAWAALVGAHLAAGSPSGAREVFDQYRALLTEELGIGPTPALEALLKRLE